MATFTRITIPNQHIVQARRWCRENIGSPKPNGRWRGLRWYHREIRHSSQEPRQIISATSGMAHQFWVTMDRPVHYIYVRDPAWATALALKYA